MTVDQNPLSGLNYEEIKRKVRELIRSGEFPNAWKDFYAGSTGSALTELLAAFSALLGYEIAKAREEAYLTTATLESSVLHIAASLGYPVNRESALEVKVKIATNPLRGITNEPAAQIFRDYSFDLFPGSLDSNGRYRPGTYVSPTFAYHGSVPLALSPIRPDGGYRDYFLIVPRPAQNAQRPDLENIPNWDEVVLHAGIWKRVVLRGSDVLSQGGRVTIRESVDNTRIVLRVVDEFTEVPIRVPLTKFFEDLIPLNPGQDRRTLPAFEFTMPYGTVILFPKGLGFPLSSNAILILDYLSPYPYTGSFSIGQVSLEQPNYQIKPATADQTDFYPNDPSPLDIHKIVATYAQPDSVAKVKYTVFGYRASQRRAITLNDYKYLFMSWRGDIVDAKAFGGRELSGSACCEISLSYVSLFYDSAGVPQVRTLLQEEKLEALRFLSEKSMAGVSLRIVDPQYVNLNYRARIHVEARAISEVQSSVSEYFKAYLPTFDSQLTVGKITADLSRIPGVRRIYPESQDPANLGPLSVLVPRPDVSYVVED